MLNRVDKKQNQHNWRLLAGVIALSAFPVLFVSGDYSGSDGQGTEAIATIKPSYEPWFQPVVELPSGEIESLMFATQAALGAGVVGFVIGIYRGRSMAQKHSEPPTS
ncbi:energy-coupling factor ABC transporter substrate-binding protein [Synechococcus sp. EJ6-Ellesmere]|uniref:energy-coupling factor ABC transporter substrate-binding protein n=1 Tax=Synechococcus sp. EJ6-Ellesmere TaxID=2823734 RepID=UPI0020CD308B|nr:energy-coupling factor ABC transporter substrate-binding protein [Synechococcus sp. EJ6-Ellesmere]MCP9825572.1 energy-coupling factor ABC transporter substrate-binding protein [Synechococcus sp. EJ6-Ellesmere]